MEKAIFESIQLRILNEMQRLHYSEYTIRLIRVEMNWIVKNISQFQFKSITDICIYRSEVATKSLVVKNQRRWLYSLIQEFYESGKLSVLLKYNPLFKKETKSLLNDFFRNLLEVSLEAASRRKLSPKTINGYKSTFAPFLLHIQKLGYETLKDVKGEDVLSYFLTEQELCKYKRHTCIDIKRSLIDASKFCSDCERISEFIPLPTNKRKNIQFLTKNEVEKLHTIFTSQNTSLSLRNKAIAAILFFMGLRAGDIGNLRLSNIDWQQDLVILQQGKTGEWLELPLLPVVGNAIYDYITQERPVSLDDHVFLKTRYPYPPLGSKGLWEIANKIYDSVGIRTELNDRRGTHLFRHHLATSMTEKGISRTVVSSTLGHIDPASINSYLTAEIEDLRQCCLSVLNFDVKEGLYENK